MRMQALVVAVVTLTAVPAAAERTTTVRRDAYACTMWAAWREYGLASLSPQGGRSSKLCPIRIAPGTEVVIVEDDDGYGAAEIRFRGKNWFVDSGRLN